jgi:hypothetical protein
MHINIYIFTGIWIGIFISLGFSDVPFSLLLIVLVLLPYLAFCALFRYIVIKNPVVIHVERGQLKLQYKKFFHGDRNVVHNVQALRGVQPFPMPVKQFMIASVRIRLTNGSDEQFFFAQSEKLTAIERSKTIASMLSQVLGIQLLE